ncbi:FAD-dependent oxidoreductase [Longimycelium tulufanense]|uniref:Glycerol-3-phosphate dehydrogenase n=1 Tax=Longimycelium tulufanense TaxID=907463 RepID=A0A8J3C6E3_9PSEU|nr:glycerol-3-phosphate dehydrogenase/oxidase [Longimycelium tulufanense]GGM39941.1 FAD-dependent oxidoreductase [Longimycelium tulufanense]
MHPSAPHSDSLNPHQRADALRGLGTEHLDILVIGGGVTGCGVALDAVTRGLRVGLVEAADFASGTSSRSGKTFHGGLRYLEQLNISLVHQALRERNLMLERLCPHLAQPQPFLIPLTTLVERAYLGAGVAIYDLLATGHRSVPYHRHLNRRATLREMPALRPDAVQGAVQYWDVRVDDARHTLTLARTAAGYGALMASRVEAISLRRNGERVTGARVRDRETGQHVDVKARVVINATGVWSDELAGMVGPSPIEVAPAKGVHLVVPRDRIHSRTGLTARTPDSVLVIRPWWNHWILGTTDTPWQHGKDEPLATASDVDYLLGQANRWLRSPLSRNDIVGVFAGLRPLITSVSGSRAGNGATSRLSRDHMVLRNAPGMITVTGGKYTTYRIMARDAVDAAARFLPGPVSPSRTDRVPLVGAAGWTDLRRQRARLATESGLSPRRIEHLLGRYGSRITEVLDLAADTELGQPLPGAPDYLAAEVAYSALNEGALHLDDVLERRTHAVMEVPDRATNVAPRVAGILGHLLGWNYSTTENELQRWLHTVEARRRSEAAPNDDTAVTARHA